MVFQNYALYPHMTVYKNMAFALKLRRFPKAEIDKRVREAAEILGIQELLGRRPKALSGGQRQRVAVGRAIVRHPKASLFDEPLSNLDAKLRVEMRQELRRIHSETGITTVYVTHDQKEALSLARRLAVMSDGRVRQVGAPREIYTRPADRFVAEFIGQANVLRGTAEPSGPQETLITTPYGKIRAAGRVAGRVTCCIRPEALTLGPCPESANRLRGQVKEVTYLGEEEQVVLRLSSLLAPAASGPLRPASAGKPGVREPGGASAPGADSGTPVDEEINLLLHHLHASVASPGDVVEACFEPADVILVPEESGI
jgi:multiple sugar transport system ATP-binding protein